MSLCIVNGGGLASANEAASNASRWELASEAGRRIGVAVAVCQPGDDPVCVGLGCRTGGRFEFVEMIAGGWLDGSTRISAGANETTIKLERDFESSHFLNIPVSRALIDGSFLVAIAEEDTLQVESSVSKYSATFPLAGFQQALKMAPNVCEELGSQTRSMRYRGLQAES
jgi:hypothetical protein